MVTDGLIKWVHGHKRSTYVLLVHMRKLEQTNRQTNRPWKRDTSTKSHHSYRIHARIGILYSRQVLYAVPIDTHEGYDRCMCVFCTYLHTAYAVHDIGRHNRRPGSLSDPLPSAPFAPNCRWTPGTVSIVPIKRKGRADGSRFCLDALAHMYSI